MLSLDNRYISEHQLFSELRSEQIFDESVIDTLELFCTKIDGIFLDYFVPVRLLDDLLIELDVLYSTTSDDTTKNIYKQIKSKIQLLNSNIENEEKVFSKMTILTEQSIQLTNSEQRCEELSQVVLEE